jgi:chromatin segregation and condensation protein Rec8/ScpA/Scc1 (kleisin family)
MDGLYVNLPESEAQFVRERATEEGLSSPDEYVARLVREERQRRLNERLAELLQEGIDSGPAEPLTPADWEYVRSEVMKRRAARSAR